MKRLCIAILFCFLIFSFFSCELVMEKPPKPTIHGLYVGLDYYNDAANHLYGTIRDVKELESAMQLLAHKFNIAMDTTWMLQEGKYPAIASKLYPTPENIQTVLRTKVQNLQHDDILFVYYAGHGYENGDLAVATPHSKDQISRLSVSDILAILNETNEGSVIFVLDSCYSGNYVPEYPAHGLIDPQAAADYNPHVFVISAANTMEKSYEIAIFRDSDEGQKFDKAYQPDDPRNHLHGVCTNLFLKAIGWDHGTGEKEKIDENGILTTLDGSLRKDGVIPVLHNGSITMSDIYAYIKKRIGRQHPMTVFGPLDMVLFSEKW